MLAALFDIPPGTTGWQTFLWQHGNDHLEILQAIQKQKNAQLVERPLYSLNLNDPKDIANWLELHQQSHSDFDTILGIQSNDLTSVDFKNPNQVKAWVFLNASEHQNARQILGI